MSHHLGEVADVAGQGVQVGAAGLDGGELGLISGAETAGVGQQPAGYLAGLRDGRTSEGRKSGRTVENRR